MRWDLCPLIVPGVFVGYLVLQLALGMTWGRNGKVWHIRRENPRGYWLDILAQVIVATLIATFMFWKH